MTAIIIARATVYKAICNLHCTCSLLF